MNALHTAVKCNPLTSVACRSLGYNVTGVPNVFGQTDHVPAQSLLTTLLSLESKQCSNDIRQFVCATAFPPCVSSAGPPRLLHPCRDFCLGTLTIAFGQWRSSWVSLWIRVRLK